MKITDFNPFRYAYLAFRLGPFIMVSYFIVFSMFNRDFTSLVLLGGAILACFVGIVTGNSLPVNIGAKLMPQDSICNSLTMASGESLSKIPLSIVFYVYALCYLSVPITEEHTQPDNVMFFAFFAIVIMLEIIWLVMFGCFGYLKIFVAGVVGIAVGLSWGEIVYQSDLQMVKSSSRDSCDTSQVSDIRTKFICTKPATVSHSVAPVTRPFGPTVAPSSVYSFAPGPSPDTAPVSNPCSKYSTNSMGIDAPCLEYIWKRSQCTTPYLNPPSWSDAQTLNGLINDSWLWATETDIPHRTGCYGTADPVSVNTTTAPDYNINPTV